MNLSLKDVLEVCGLQAVHIEILKAEIQRLEAEKRPPEHQPLSDEARESFSRVLGLESNEAEREAP